MMLSTGFSGSAYGSWIDRPPLSFAFWLQPISLIWLVCIHDSSRYTFAFAIHRLMLDGILDKASSDRLFTPLYRLMTSRYCRGDAVPPALGERDLHPHDDQVVKVQTLPPVPEYCYSFRMNESHQPWCSGRLRDLGCDAEVICRR
jgi:hypothetical protein